jgi:ABC-2 type transport system permease protein
MSKIGLIIKREYGSRVRKKSFIIMTLLGPLLIVGFYALAGLIGLQEGDKMEVVILDESNVVNIYDFPADEDFVYIGAPIQHVDSLSEFIKLESDLPRVGLYLPASVISGEATIYFDTPLSVAKQSKLEGLVKSFVQKLKIDAAGISQDQYDDMQVNMNIVTVNVDTGEKSFGAKAVIGLMFATFIYIFIFMYGVMVMRGVLEEKTSRIVEIMVSSVKPFQLMMGKILGIALVGLTQFFVWILLSSALMIAVSSAILPDVYSGANVAGGPNQLISEQLKSQTDAAPNEKINEMVVDIMSVPWALLLGLFLFYFLGGYLLYASLFAAVGSAVDSETETQQFMLPITIPLIFGFIVSIFSILNPGGTAIVWLSHIPLTSPVAMLVRVAGGDYAWWEVVVSMVTLILTFILTTKLAAKIYKTGILMYGKKTTYKELFKWLRYK